MATSTFTLPTDALSYPVYAADQVLTSDDLNSSFEYLDQQDQLSRIYLLGMGIVCGFELSVDLTNFVISVSGGSGITSLGYLVFGAPINLTYYQAYTVPTSVNTADQYGPFKSTNTTTLFQLQTSAYVTNLSATDQAKWTALSAGGTAFLTGKRVVVYLEISEDQGQSCLTGNCDGPGATMNLTLRYLLVTDPMPISNPNLNVGAILSASELPDLYLPRFCVPATALSDFTSIYNAYNTLFDTTTVGNTISQISGALQNLYTFLNPILSAYTSSPFTNIQTTLTTILAGIQKNKPWAIQYFYDFLDDLIGAYREIQGKCEAWVSTCTPNISAFPLHLSLGIATLNTAGQVDAERDYFIPSSLISGNPQITEELRCYFDRINQMISVFVIPAYTIVNNGVGVLSTAKQTTVAIRITPSLIGNAPLSQKSIPYYYPIKSSDPIQNDWNYELTKAGKANENLGYNASLYNVSPGGLPFISPLQYDILPYNFFRIEGHIGQNYTTVLNNLTTQINNYRLPFNVLALKLGTDASDIQPSAASFDDLTSQYDVLISSLLCNLGNQVCFYGGITYTSFTYIPILQRTGILKDDLLASEFTAHTAPAPSAHAVMPPTAVDTNIGPEVGAASGAEAASGAAATSSSSSSTSSGSSSAALTYDFSNIAATGLATTDVLKYTNILPINLRPIFQMNIYSKGQFLSSQPCYASMSQSTTYSVSVGLTYMNDVKSGVTIAQTPPTSTGSITDYLLALLDMIDNVVADVFYVQLGYFNLSDFTTKYQTMTSYAASIITLINNNAGTYTPPANLVTYLTRLQGSCNLGQLTALANDYTARYTALQQSLLFGNFITANPAIDHRAGVPKGGTFLLVYYEKPVSSSSSSSSSSLASNLAANIGNAAGLQNVIAGLSSSSSSSQASVSGINPNLGKVEVGGNVGLKAMARAAGPQPTAKAVSASLLTTKTVVPISNITATSTLASAASSSVVSKSVLTGTSTSTVNQLLNLVQDKQYGFSAAQQSQIIGLLNSKASVTTPTSDSSFNLPNNGVVADFFLPYLYNPTAGPITYVFPPSAGTTTPVQTANFVVSPNVFLSNDPNTYHFTIDPVVTQGNIVTQTSDPTQLSNPQNLPLVATDADITLIPQAANVTTTVTSTLTYEDITQQITIIKPLATFTMGLTQGLVGSSSSSALSSSSFSPILIPNPPIITEHAATATVARPVTTAAATTATAAKPVETATTAKPVTTATPVEAKPVATTPIETKPVTATEASTTSAASATSSTTQRMTTGGPTLVPGTGATAASSSSSEAVKSTAIESSTTAATIAETGSATGTVKTTPAGATTIVPTEATGVPVEAKPTTTETIPAASSSSAATIAPGATEVKPVAIPIGTAPIGTHPIVGGGGITESSSSSPSASSAGSPSASSASAASSPSASSGNASTSPVASSTSSVSSASSLSSVSSISSASSLSSLSSISSASSVSSASSASSPSTSSASSTSGVAVIPRMLNLAATDPNATAYAWVINGFISLIPPVASPVVNFETLLSTLNNPTNITITLTLSYTLNGVTGTDVKTGVVPTQSLEAQVNGTPFQPTYNA